MLDLRMKDGCRSFEHNTVYLQNTLALDIDYLAEVQDKQMKRCRTGVKAPG